jgi:hypothetical protein
MAKCTYIGVWFLLALLSLGYIFYLFMNQVKGYEGYKVLQLFYYYIIVLVNLLLHLLLYLSLEILL